MTELFEQLANYRLHFDQAIGHSERPPRSDESAIESEPHEGDLIMVDVPSRSTDTDQKTPRRWLVYASLAAAAVIVLVVALALFDRTEESSELDVVDSPADVESPPVVTLPPEVATVLEYYDATNRGDIPALLALLTGSAAEDSGDGTFEQVFAVANRQATVIEPCRVADADVDGQTLIECTTSYYDDWFGAAGINTDAVVEQFTVTDDAKISAISNAGPDVASSDRNDDDFAYMRAFWDWLGPTHFDVYDEIRGFDGESFPGFGRDGRDMAEDMAVALQYVDEFLAQSDVYPIAPQGS